MTTTSEVTDLDDYLRRGPIVTTGPFAIGVGGGGHPEKMLVCFGNGSRALAKLATNETQLSMAHHEVAARLVGRSLDSELILPTAMRVITGPSGPVQVSLQLIAPEPNVWLPDLGRYDDATTSEAAVIDYLVEQSDRMNNNYMGYESVNGETQLVLVDHGYSFGLEGRPGASPFVNMHRGRALDVDVLERVRALGTLRQLSAVGAHLSVAALAGLQQRIDSLLNNGTI